MDPSVEALLEPLRASPRDTAVLLDFDGTLSPIVRDPARSEPLAGVVPALTELGERFGLVAVVSGRTVSFLAAHLPDDVELSGLYGLEARRDGAIVEHPDAARWRPVIDELAQRAIRDAPAGIDVEHKGLSLTLHFRRTPAAGDAASIWAETVAADAGLHVRAAKMSLELHPPVAVDKGTVVEELVGGATGHRFTAACFIGDDVGDLPAFDALDRLATRGVTTLRIAVETIESAPELLRRAELRVAGPEGALELLRALLA
jgi:trehalose 6-phosphate phosphatase